MNAYAMGYNLGAMVKEQSPLTLGGSDRLAGGTPDLLNKATERVRSSLKPEKKSKPHIRPPSPPNVPAAGTAGFGEAT